MNFCSNLKVTRPDLDKCLTTLELCDNVLQCVCCSFFLQKSKQQALERILALEDKLPNEITRVKIPLYPIPDNKFYFGFQGIETIVYNLFRTTNKKHKERLKEHHSFLKVYYERNSLFNIPIIQIEVLFFGRIHPRSIDELWESLQKEIISFTGSVGDIDIIDIEDESHIERLLEIPLLLGYPEFKQEGVFDEHKFSTLQLREMNHLHSAELIPLDMDKIFENDSLNFFKLQVQAIELELEDEHFKSSEKEILNAIFYNNYKAEESGDEDEYDELPF